MKRHLPRRTAGFTLVELMVVMVIIGLAATAVMLAIPDEGGSVFAEAERFAARAKAARDNAIVESRPAALALGPSGYAVSRRVSGAWQEERTYPWARGTRVRIGGGDEGGTRFDSTGLAVPLQVMIQRGETTATIEIGHDGSIQIRR